VQMSDLRSLLNPLGNATGGALAGMFAVTVSYPFDLIKTRCHFEVGKRAAAAAQSGVTAPALKIGIREMGSTIIKEGGYVSLYRGLDQLMPEAAFKTMLRFAVFRRLQQGWMDTMETDSVSVLGNLLCGAASGAVETTLVVQPFERGKTLRADFKNPYTVWGSELRTNGAGAALRSIYTGYIPCLGRQVGNQATAFTAFYSGKSRYLEWSGAPELNTIQRLAGGFFAGCTACCVTMPMDVAKSIAQKQTSGALQQTTRQIFRQVVARQGILGLYVGLAPRLLRVGLDRACGFMAFDTIGEWLLNFDHFHT